MTSPARKFRVGLVGAGYVSEYHIRALQRLPQVSIVGIMDLDQSRAQAQATQFKLAAYPSLDAMGAQGMDVVHVLTPPSSHTAVALSALRLGCHVLIEKPMAISVEECDQLEAESAARGLRVCVNHTMLADSTFRQTLDAVRTGAVGDILSVDIFRSSIFPPYRGGPLPPQYVEGGYPFRDLGVHALYMLRELLGPIENVTAEFWNAGARSSDPNIHFDEWRALVRCAKGSGQITLSWNVRPLQHILMVQGTGGTLRSDLYSMFLTKRRNTPAPKAIERVLNAMAESTASLTGVTMGAARFATGRIVQYQSLHTFVREFYERLESGQPMPVTFGSAREVVDWTERVARQADQAKSASRPISPRASEPAIVVTGANGHLGRALVRRLLTDGERVRLFVRREPGAEFRDNPRVDVVLGELGDPASVERALAHATAVYHCGAAMAGGWPAYESGTIAGTRNVVESCLKTGVKLVYVSSLSVLHQLALGDGVTEASPLEPRAEERGVYTRAKLEAETFVTQAVKERHLKAVIVRPGLIWSEEVLLPASVGVKAGRRLVMIGDRNLILPLIHVNDVVSGMILAMKKNISTGEIFHLVDDDLLRREELAQLYVRSLSPRLGLVHVPMAAITGAAAVLRRGTGLLGHPMGPTSYRLRSGVVSLNCDCTKAKAELGWRPEIPSATTMRRLLQAANKQTQKQ